MVGRGGGYADDVIGGRVFRRVVRCCVMSRTEFCIVFVSASHIQSARRSPLVSSSRPCHMSQSLSVTRLPSATRKKGSFTIRNVTNTNSELTYWWYFCTCEVGNYSFCSITQQQRRRLPCCLGLILESLMPMRFRICFRYSTLLQSTASPSLTQSFSHYSFALLRLHMLPRIFLLFALISAAWCWSPSPVDSSVYDRGLVDEKLK